MNFMGNIGGAIVPILVGMIVTLTGSYYWAIILFMAFAIGLCIFPIGINMNKTVGSASCLSYFALVKTLYSMYTG